MCVCDYLIYVWLGYVCKNVCGYDVTCLSDNTSSDSLTIDAHLSYSAIYKEI